MEAKESVNYFLKSINDHFFDYFCEIDSNLDDGKLPMPI